MFATLFSIALFALPAIASTFNIDTPKEIQSCKPITFDWQGGKKPYDLVIVASKAPCGDILTDLGGSIEQTSFSWDKATIPANMSGHDVSLSLQDAEGNEAWSNAISYVVGDTTCLGGTTTPAPANVEATPFSEPTTTPAAVAAGAANVGNGPLSGGALTFHQISSSVFIISALTALVAFSL